MYEAHGRHGFDVLSGNKVHAEAVDDTLCCSVDVVLYLLCLAYQCHEHHLCYGIHLLEVDGLSRELPQCYDGIIDSFLEFYIHRM